MVAEGLSFMRDDANILSDPSVERLIAARIAHGDSPHTVRALRADLRDQCSFLAQQGLAPETCGSEPLRRWQARLAARRLAPATIARHLSSARALFGDLERGAYYALLAELEALGTVIDQLDLDPAVLQLSTDS